MGTYLLTNELTKAKGFFVRIVTRSSTFIRSFSISNFAIFWLGNGVRQDVSRMKVFHGVVSHLIHLSGLSFRKIGFLRETHLVPPDSFDGIAGY